MSFKHFVQSITFATPSKSGLNHHSRGSRPSRSRGSRLFTGRLFTEQLESRALLAPVAAGPTTSVPDLVPSSDSGPSATDNKTSINTPIFFGTAKGAAVVNVVDGSTPLGQAQVAAGTGYWFFTAPRLADGVHMISAQAFSAASVPGRQSKPLKVEIGTAAPADPTIYGPTAATDSGVKGDFRTNVGKPMLIGTAPAGSTVALWIDGVPAGRATSNKGVWTLTTPALADGPHAITAKTTDVFGNWSGQAALTITIDRSGPTAQLVYAADQAAVFVTFSRPVAGLSLAAFRLAGQLSTGQTFDEPLSSSVVRQYISGLSLTQVDATTYKLQVSIDQMPRGFYILRLVAKKSGIVDTVVGNGLAVDAAVSATIT